MYKYDFVNEFSPDEVIDYLRKSRSDDPALSVEEVLARHETILDEWSEKNLGAKVPEENKYREIVSGETIDDRPEIQKVLKRIESPKIKAVKVVEVQRLSRGDLEDAGRLIKLLRYTNTFVITPTKTYDLKDEYDRDMFERELKRGNEYLEYQKKIMSRGRLLSVSQGNFIASIPPYGYDKVWVMDGKRKCPTLRENKAQADAVRMIFDMYVNKNMGGARICNALDALGIKPLKGKRWSPAAIKEMLSNVHYIGKVKWNWRKTITVVEDGEIIKTRPKSSMDEYLIYEGRHEGIISEELFNAAQEKQGRNHRAKGTTKVRNPLAGLLYCSCGKAMSLRIYKEKDGSERSAARLSCNDQTHCNSGSCLYQDMIDRVCEILRQSIADFEVLMNNDSTNNIELHERLINNLKNKLKELEEKELLQWEAQSSPDPASRMPQEIFKRLNEKLLKEKEEVQRALHNAYDSMPEPDYYIEKVKKFKDALTALKAPNADPEEQNRLLKQCIERIEYSRERPQRMKRLEGEKKGSRFSVGGAWTDPPIKIKVKLIV